MDEVQRASTEPQKVDPAKENPDSQVINLSKFDTNNSYPKGWKLFLVILPLYLGTLLVAVDNTIIAVAIPEISTTFGALDEAAWYGSGYLLTVTAFQPTFGKIYKFFNVKLVYLASVALFEAGSVLCAGAPQSSVFILGRALAGVGAAGLFQGALCTIGLFVPIERRPIFLGIVVSAFALTTCCGPILGGALTSDVSWRWCFWINLPIGLVDFLLIFAFLKVRNSENADRSKPIRDKLAHLDPLGGVTLIAAVCCLLLALQWGGTTYAWDNPRVICLFILFLLLVILFCFLQWRLGDRGTIPLRILRQRTVLVGCVYNFMLNMTNYTDGYYLPFYFQAAQSVSAAQSGIRFIPLALPEVIAILFAGVVVNKTGHYVPLMVLGSAIGIIGTALLTTIATGTRTVEWASYMLLTGVGIGFGINIPYTAIQVVLSEGDLDIGNATALPVANAIFIYGLKETISKKTSAVSPEAAIKAGPTNFEALTSDPTVLQALQMSYVTAVRNTLYFALAAVSSTLFIGLCMQWKQMKVATKNPKKPRAIAEDEVGVARTAD